MTHRLFIAAGLPDYIKGQISLLQSNLDKLGLPVSWTHPDKLFIELNQLGRIPDTQVNTIKKIVNSVARSTSQFEIQPFFLETLYLKHDASQIYLGILDQNKALTEMQRNLSEALFTSLQIPQPFRFLPQIVIGELKRDDPQMTKTFLDKVSTYQFAPLEPFVLDTLMIFETHLSKNGAHFQPAASFALSATP